MYPLFLVKRVENEFLSKKLTENKFVLADTLKKSLKSYRKLFKIVINQKILMSRNAY